MFHRYRASGSDIQESTDGVARLGGSCYEDGLSQQCGHDISELHYVCEGRAVVFELADEEDWCK
jgi:hypothetical protein